MHRYVTLHRKSLVGRITAVGLLEECGDSHSRWQSRDKSDGKIGQCEIYIFLAKV